MYSSKKITDLLEQKGVVPIRCDMTRKSARTRALTRLLNSYGAYSIPFMVVTAAVLVGNMLTSVLSKFGSHAHEAMALVTDVK